MEKIPGRTRSFSALVNVSRHALIVAIRVITHTSRMVGHQEPSRNRVVGSKRIFWLQSLLLGNYREQATRKRARS